MASGDDDWRDVNVKDEPLDDDDVKEKLEPDDDDDVKLEPDDDDDVEGGGTGRDDSSSSSIFDRYGTVRDPSRTKGYGPPIGRGFVSPKTDSMYVGRRDSRGVAYTPAEVFRDGATTLSYIRNSIVCLVGHSVADEQRNYKRLNALSPGPIRLPAIPEEVLRARELTRLLICMGPLEEREVANYVNETRRRRADRGDDPERRKHFKFRVYFPESGESSIMFLWKDNVENSYRLPRSLLNAMRVAAGEGPPGGDGGGGGDGASSSRGSASSAGGGRDGATSSGKGKGAGKGKGDLSGSGRQTQQSGMEWVAEVGVEGAESSSMGEKGKAGPTPSSAVSHVFSALASSPAESPSGPAQVSQQVGVSAREVLEPNFA